MKREPSGLLSHRQRCRASHLGDTKLQLGSPTHVVLFSLHFQEALKSFNTSGKAFSPKNQTLSESAQCRLSVD